MNIILTVKGFKCFKDSEFLLNDVTLLTGSNGTGKSSLIQALLLSRLAIEKNLILDNESCYVLAEPRVNLQIPLNNEYHLRLGKIFDIIREEEDLTKDEHIEITIGDECYVFAAPTNENENTSLSVSLQENQFETISPLRRKNFYYLHTERLGPRHSLEVNYTNTLHCGWQGEYTAQVLINAEKSVRFSSAMLKDGGLKLEQLTNKWLAEICPGVSITAIPLGELSAQIKIKSSASKSDMLASNIGFGISYALPIIVNGLIAQKNCIFIVENPEAHLHPKGQSNIGYFLGKLANAGVKVIVETHSEHVVNGVRRAALSSDNLKPEDVNIYFFNGFDSKKNIDVKLITIEDNGDLSDFPLDFFDQTRQDLLEILKLSKR